MSFKPYVSNTNLLPPWIITIYKALTYITFALTLALKVTEITEVTVLYFSFKFWLFQIIFCLGSEGLEEALVDAIFTT
jgi:hypothetical protein